MPPAGQGAPTVTGPVLETMNAASYTYVRVKTDAGDVWAASSEFKVAVGDRITVALEMPMENFHSQTLKRDFPLIYFTTRVGREGEALPASPARCRLTARRRRRRRRAVTAQVTEPIQPAPGGTTIANVWANRKSLAGKSVTVRGKVMKFNGGIMGRNWIHIQDGRAPPLTAPTTARDLGRGREGRRRDYGHRHRRHRQGLHGRLRVRRALEGAKIEVK